MCNLCMKTNSTFLNCGGTKLGKNGLRKGKQALKYKDCGAKGNEKIDSSELFRTVLA